MQLHPVSTFVVSGEGSGGPVPTPSVQSPKLLCGRHVLQQAIEHASNRLLQNMTPA